MSKMKKKRAVSLLLCLGIVATMSFGSMTVSASTPEYQDSINTIFENDYLYADSGKYTIQKDGYYLFLTGVAQSTEDDPTEWHNLCDFAAKSSAEYEDFLGEFKKYSAGDTVKFSDGIDTSVYSNDYLLYKESESSDYVTLALSRVEASTGPYVDEGMFTWETTKEAGDEVVVHFKAKALDGATLSLFRIYTTGDDGEQEEYTSGDDLSSTFPDGVSEYEFDVSLYSNGDYTFWMMDSAGCVNESTLTVNCIDSSVNPEPDDYDAPVMDYYLSTTDTGLSASDALSVTVTTDRDCTISGEGMPTFENTSSAEFIIPENGVYTFYATDPNTESTSQIKVTITSYGDGTIDPDYDDNVNNNDNPLNGDNKNNYWQNLENNGDLSADGNLIDLVSLTVNDDGSVTAKGGKSNPSDKLGVLPQTGITSWVVAIGCSLFAIIAGTILMFRKGIFKKLLRKGGK